MSGSTALSLTIQFIVDISVQILQKYVTDLV